MKLMGRKRIIGLALLMAFGSGCKKVVPPKPVPPPPVWEIPADRPDQVRDLSERTEQLNNSIVQLNGAPHEQRQRVMADMLENLSKILRLAQGSSISMEFTNRINLVEMARAVVARPDMSDARVEASENEAFRASIDILEQIAARDATSDEAIPPLINAARLKLDGMYAATGPMHDLAAQEGMDAVDHVVQRLRDDLFAQFGNVPAQ